MASTTSIVERFRHEPDSLLTEQYVHKARAAARRSV